MPSHEEKPFEWAAKSAITVRLLARLLRDNYEQHAFWRLDLRRFAAKHRARVN
jgi:hypothetical protein